jgi:hypothetical protein
MGRLFACVLFVAACGDNLIVDPSSSKTVTNFGGESVTTPTAHYVPAVCGTSSWSLPFPNTPSVDVAIASEREQTSVLVTPTSGGAVDGFVLNDRLVVTSDPQATKLGIDGFSTVSSAIIEHRLVAAGIAGDSVQVHVLDADFQNPALIGKVPATAVAKPAVMQLGTATVMATGGVDGLSLTQISPQFEVGETLLVGASSAVTSLSATQYGQSIVATWTTEDHNCYVERLAQFVAGNATHSMIDCDHVRVAANIGANEARIVFDGTGGLRMTTVSEMKIDGFSTQLRADARGSRVIFDGERYWVSYIDARNNIVAGFLDDNAQLISTAIEGPTPMGESYELALLDGKPTVFSLDMQNGYQANSLCVVPEAD